MMQFIVGLLGIYMGLNISLERIMGYIFKYSDHDLSHENGEYLSKVLNWMEKQRNIMGIIGFVFGIIIFIAPTPTVEVIDVPVPHVQEVTQRFIGDFIPALCLIFASLILNNNIVGFFNLKGISRIKSFVGVLNQYSFLIGIITIIISFLHLIFGSSILF